MRIEIFPLIFGVIVALLAIGIIFDAWTPDSTTISRERRRRPRIERHRNGEALIGFGVLALAAAFIGRDSWRYSVLVVIIGAAFLLVGALLNGRYVRELFVNRGPLRRREEASAELPQQQERQQEAPQQPRGHPETPLPRAQRAVVADVEKPIPNVGSEPARPTRTEGDWDGRERRSSPRQ